MATRTPRTIALEKNNSANFADPDNYDAIAGVPAGVSPAGDGKDHVAFNPTNPPEKPAPARNLKGG